jgi:hypothetical protein
MKLFIILIFITICFTQEKKNSLSLNEISISDALFIISEKLGYDITFSSEKSLNRKVSF